MTFILSDIDKLKALPRPLKIIAGILAVDLVVVALAIFALDDAVSERLGHVGELGNKIQQQRRHLADVSGQVAQLPQMQAKYDGALEKGLLATPDRLKLADEVQAMVPRHRLSDLTYKLDAEDLTATANPKFKQASSQVTLSNGGLLDGDVLSFWDDVLDDLPAHYQVVEASMERSHEVDAALLGDVRNGRPASTLTAKLVFRWLSLRPPVKEEP